jgi:hypothetical protein
MWLIISQQVRALRWVPSQLHLVRAMVHELGAILASPQVTASTLAHDFPSRGLLTGVTGSQCQLPWSTFTNFELDQGFLPCFSSWLDYLQSYQSLESTKAARDGRMVKIVETSAFETLEGLVQEDTTQNNAMALLDFRSHTPLTRLHRGWLASQKLTGVLCPPHL